VGRLLPRLLIPAAVAAAAVLAVVLAGTGGDNDGRTATASPAAKPLVDPNGTAAKAPRRPYVILLILDEFPGDSLLDRDGKIDAARYPNFAALAANATWFPNATSSYDSTPKAVPLILDGKRPTKGLAPDQRGHPRSLYDAFGRRGYRIVSSEEATAVCPPRYCRGARRRRPAIIPHLNRGRPERLNRFIAKVRPGRPTFWMKHALLPHGPYLFLPSGRRTRAGARDPVPGMNSPRGHHDRFLTDHNHQRYMLQLGFTDYELGKLLRRLVRTGMYDKTLIAVTADHGFSWETGVPDRRRVRQGNVDEIAPVPLFIKAPGQRRGRIDRSYVRTLDIAPTIADILNIRLPYRADGRSAFSRATRRRRVVRLPNRSFTRIVRISARRYEARRRRIVRHRLRLFGSGPTGLFSGIGPHRELIGRPVTALRVAGRGRVRASVVGGRRLRAVRRASGIVPAQIAGDLRGGRRGQKRDIAVAVNGRIQAVGRTFYLRGDRTEHYGVMVPESSLHDGRNSVQVFEVGRGGTLRLLARA
jgi:Sulfatase